MRWLPRSLFGRMVLLMTVGLVVAQLAGAALQFAERQRTVGRTVSHELAQRVAAVYRAVDAERGAGRRQLAALLSAPRQQLSIETGAPPAAAAGPTFLAGFPDHLKELLGADVEMRPVQLPRFGAFSFDLYLRLASGEWLRIRGGAPEEIFAWPWPLLLNLGLMLVAVVVLVVFAARSTVRPLTDLAGAAHGLADDLRRPPMPEDGPSEVREAARAFNAMQSRIRAGIEERERFLAAISHDLKTPVTRLRLRSEMLGDADLRERFRSDVEDMQQLLDSALDFLRGEPVEEPVQPIDLVALAESLVDDFAGTGAASLRAPDSLRYDGHPKALKRALTNLIDNALKYGGRADVEVVATPDGVRITVEDDGPGLAGEDLERVFEPFYRVEGSRSRETGGTGLGLAIVRKFAESHGGRVFLANREQGGLRAVLELPHPAAAPA
ncbi:MAG: HAMP domain-containing protein [Rhodocyclaceae bacterium]|nr:HAMP domain-containing protein [Rhodocyclaceae bacterium]